MTIMESGKKSLTKDLEVKRTYLQEKTNLKSLMKIYLLSTDKHITDTYSDLQDKIISTCLFSWFASKARKRIFGMPVAAPGAM